MERRFEEKQNRREQSAPTTERRSARGDLNEPKIAANKAQPATTYAEGDLNPHGHRPGILSPLRCHSATWQVGFIS